MNLYEFTAVFSGESDEMFESLGLQAPEDDVQLDLVTIDLDKVESFYPSSKNYNDDEKETTNIITASGEKWTVIMKYQDFKKLF